MPTVRDSSHPSSREPSRVLSLQAARQDLVDGDAVLDVRARGLAGVDAGQVRGAGARVVAGPVAQRVAVLVGEAREHEHLLAPGLEGPEDPRRLEVRPLTLRHPIGEGHPVRHVREGDAQGRGLGGRERRPHGVQGGERDAGAQSAQDRPPRQMLPRHPVHDAVSSRRRWKGRLLTISSTSAEKR